MAPKCSIVIRAYNEEKHIGRLLEGIAHQTISDVQIILVDSGSSDRTLDIASTYPVEIVSITPEEFSFGRSLNRGIERTKADFVIFASAHVYPVYPDWLEKLTAPFRDERVGLTYGKQRGNQLSQFSERQIFITWYPENAQPIQDHPFCNNANAAIRRSLWEEHAYDELLPALEDIAWAKWLHENGYLISYVSEAEIIHVHEQSMQGVYNRYKREGMAFKQIYPQERFNLYDLLRLFFANSLNDMKVAMTQKVFWKNFGDIINFRWMQFYGTYHGYAQSGPLTWQLKKAFYFPKSSQEISGAIKRNINPIKYSEMEETQE